MKPQKYTVILTSNEPWGKVWFSKQHYAYELSKLGHEVYFLNPCEKWRISNLFSFSLCIDSPHSNLNIISYKNNFPQKIFSRLFSRINDYINCLKIKKITPKDRPTIWWLFDPYRFTYINSSILNLCVYHVADPYMYLWQDIYHAKNADLILCTNLNYIPHYKTKHNNILHIPHGLSDEEQKIDENEVIRAKKTYGDFCIFVGSITKDLDLKMLKKICDENITIVIAGKEMHLSKDWEILKSKKNIHFLGEVHAKDIKHLIKASFAGLVIYSNSAPKKDYVRTPLKAVNYLAQRKPIISSYELGIKELNSHAIFIATEVEKYVNFVLQARNGDITVNDKNVTEYLQKISYSKLIGKILNNLHK